MEVNPLRTLFSLYKNENESHQDNSAASKTRKFAEEASFFAFLFKKHVRPEDIAPFLWNRLHKEDKKKRRQKLRKVNKKSGSSEAQLRKRDHEPDRHENPCPNYI